VTNPGKIRLSRETPIPRTEYSRDSYQMGREMIEETSDRPLTELVKQGHVEQLRRTIQPTSVNLRDASGMTALHWAAKIGSLPAIEALLQGGADPNILDDRGWTPLTIAIDEVVKRRDRRGIRQSCAGAILKAVLDGSVFDFPIMPPVERHETFTRPLQPADGCRKRAGPESQPPRAAPV